MTRPSGIEARAARTGLSFFLSFSEQADGRPLTGRIRRADVAAGPVIDPDALHVSDVDGRAFPPVAEFLEPAAGLLGHPFFPADVGKEVAVDPRFFNGRFERHAVLQLPQEVVEALLLSSFHLSHHFDEESASGAEVIVEHAVAGADGRV